MKVRTPGSSRKYPRRVPMRLVIEILNGCVCDVHATAQCEVVIIDKDAMSDETLPDGERGYCSVWEADVNPPAVSAGLSLARRHGAERYQYRLRAGQA